MFMLKDCIIFIRVYTYLLKLHPFLEFCKAHKVTLVPCRVLCSHFGSAPKTKLKHSRALSNNLGLFGFRYFNGFRDEEFYIISPISYYVMWWQTSLYFKGAANQNIDRGACIPCLWLKVEWLQRILLKNRTIPIGTYSFSISILRQNTNV